MRTKQSRATSDTGNYRDGKFEKIYLATYDVRTSQISNRGPASGFSRVQLRGEMKKTLSAVLLLLLTTSVWAQAPKAPPKIKVGDIAPDFTLLAFDGKDVKPVSLHDYKGKKNVVLAFYVFAFTGG